MQNQQMFYLASTEGPRHGQPWKCYPIMRIVWNAKHPRDDGMLVSVSPQITGSVYNNRKHKELVLFARGMGESLFPMSDFPIFVNICVINIDQVKVTSKAEESDLTFFDLGVIGNFEQVNKWKYG